MELIVTQNGATRHAADLRVMLSLAGNPDHLRAYHSTRLLCSANHLLLSPRDRPWAADHPAIWCRAQHMHTSLRSYASLACVVFPRITLIAACCTLGMYRISECAHLGLSQEIRNVSRSTSCEVISKHDQRASTYYSSIPPRKATPFQLPARPGQCSALETRRFSFPARQIVCGIVAQVQRVAFFLLTSLL